ncbi:MAG: nucleotide sugar dehydrogenase [Candidatus Omnitrophica bacterium]|nr:nucleotide sugar dehydrogenase [Candidatus Omnitrophota bacterium]
MRQKQIELFIVGGCGHVGLPLGIMLADAGIKVKLYDLNASRTELVRAGKMPFIEYGADPILGRVINKNLFIADSLSELREANGIIVTIGTPVDEYHNPKTGPLFKMVQDITPYLKNGQHLIIRSTVCPGMTRELKRVLDDLPVKLHVSNCPERISQGYAIRELKELPQIVSGFSKEAVEFASAVFRKLGCKITLLAVEEAELVKLFLNAWRYIQFSISNQFYVMASRKGINYLKIHEAMTEGYERGKGIPRPGFTAGPCLLKDTLQLSAMTSGNFPLGQAAMLINEGLPSFLVEELRRETDLSKETVGILGMAFKANVDDTRDSLAFKLRKQLLFYGATVLCSDALIRDPAFVSTDELLRRCRIIIIGAPHDAYKSLRFPAGKKVIDIWGMSTEKKRLLRGEPDGARKQIAASGAGMKKRAI